MPICVSADLVDRSHIFKSNQLETRVQCDEQSEDEVAQIHRTERAGRHFREYIAGAEYQFWSVVETEICVLQIIKMVYSIIISEQKHSYHFKSPNKTTAV